MAGSQVILSANTVYLLHTVYSGRDALAGVVDANHPRHNVTPMAELPFVAGSAISGVPLTTFCPEELHEPWPRFDGLAESRVRG